MSEESAMRFDFEMDKYDNPTCPVPVVEWFYNDDDALQAEAPRLCGADLTVVWSFGVPVVPERIAADDVAKAADASRWQVSCENGHVLACSSNEQTTYDGAEPFDPSAVFPGMFAGPSGTEQR